MLEFVQSLGVFGYVLLALCAVLIWNIRKILRFRSSLDDKERWRDLGETPRLDYPEIGDDGRGD